MLGPQKERRLDRPVLASLEQLVPPDQFYRQLEAKLDLSFVRDWVTDKYAERGRPSIDPVVFFKLQLVMFFEGIRSERKLIETASLHLAQRWYLGYPLDEPLPDHSSLTRIRTRLGLPIFQRFFEHVVELCQAAGLIWGKELFFDGTKVRANADIDSLSPRFYQDVKAQAQEHLTALFRADAAGAAAPETAPAAGESANAPAGAATPEPAATAVPTALPFAGTAEAAAQLAAENTAQWKLLEERRLDPKRPPSGPYRRIIDFRVSTTDPDAAPIGVGAVAKLGYHDHYAVDGGKARIIVGALVTPADVQDNQVLLDLLDRVRFRFQLPVRRVIADSKYATLENLHALAARGLRAYMPIVEYDKSSPFFRQQDFTYDPASDTYRCPQGETLSYRATSYSKQLTIYQAPDEACAACPLRERCTDSREGRKLTRPFLEDYRERARELQTTEAYKKALRKRQVWVEPLFGEAKEWHQLRRFLLRGLANVNMQALLVASGQNLKRWLAATTRGQRPATAQRAVAPIPPGSLVSARPGHARLGLFQQAGPFMNHFHRLEC
jgi:transposase